LSSLVENIAVAAVFMVIELAIIAKWIKSRQQRADMDAWTPFRKLLLDSVIRHSEDLVAIVNQFDEDLQAHLGAIKANGSLTHPLKTSVADSLRRAKSRITESQGSFFFTVQTVAPALQPYAAEYCREVMWFGDTVTKSLDKALGYLGEIEDDWIHDNSKTSHPLNGVNAQVMSIRIFRDTRFRQFKSTFTSSVWKRESLHYHEPDGEFLEPHDYAMALESEKSIAELKNIPRTAPIKSFFDD